MIGAKSNWAIYTMSLLNRMVEVCEVCLMLVVVVLLPRRYKSNRFWGMGSMNGGWLRVVWFVAVRLAMEV
jgi:hypothetical protein